MLISDTICMIKIRSPKQTSPHEVFKHPSQHLKSKSRVERMHTKPYTIRDESEQFF